jgi:exodeoxyribonuclease-3
MKKIISYNVNGIRAAENKGLSSFLLEQGADVVCFQELKAEKEQINVALYESLGYHCFWHSAEKKGYSGVGLLTKEKPKHVEVGCGTDWIDREGRIIRADFEKYSVISVYIPSGSSGEERQDLKMVFLDFFRNYIKELSKSLPRLVISGDYNICHQAIDIHDPVRNAGMSGFLPEERAWFTEFLTDGYVDSFRQKHPAEKNHYSWWSYRMNARANNKGWRIDYHILTEALAPYLNNAFILPQAHHSDHCPVVVELDI